MKMTKKNVIKKPTTHRSFPYLAASLFTDLCFVAYVIMLYAGMLATPRPVGFAGLWSLKTLISHLTLLAVSCWVFFLACKYCAKKGKSMPQPKVVLRKRIVGFAVECCLFLLLFLSLLLSIHCDVTVMLNPTLLCSFLRIVAACSLVTFLQLRLYKAAVKGSYDSSSELAAGRPCDSSTRNKLLRKARLITYVLACWVWANYLGNTLLAAVPPVILDPLNPPLPANVSVWQSMVELFPWLLLAWAGHFVAYGICVRKSLTSYTLRSNLTLDATVLGLSLCAYLLVTDMALWEQGVFLAMILCLLLLRILLYKILTKGKTKIVSSDDKTLLSILFVVTRVAVYLSFLANWEFRGVLHGIWGHLSAIPLSCLLHFYLYQLCLRRGIHHRRIIRDLTLDLLPLALGFLLLICNLSSAKLSTEGSLLAFGICAASIVLPRILIHSFA